MAVLNGRQRKVRFDDRTFVQERLSMMTSGDRPGGPGIAWERLDGGDQLELVERVRQTPAPALAAADAGAGAGGELRKRGRRGGRWGSGVGGGRGGGAGGGGGVRLAKAGAAGADSIGGGARGGSGGGRGAARGNGMTRRPRARRYVRKA